MNPNIINILNILDKVGSKTITVFGDYCLDKYLYINTARNELSLETGLIAYQVEMKRLFPGAGGTITNNLRALGVPVYCIGLTGDDGEGYELKKELNKIGANTDFMITSNEIMTGTYTKPMQTTDGETYTEMSRIDFRNFKETLLDLEYRMIEKLEQVLPNSDGVIIIDQFIERNFSAITDRVRDKLAEKARQYPDKFFYADSRGHAGEFRNVIIKCNEHELPGDSQHKENRNESDIINDGKILSSESGKPVIVTVGAVGAYVFENERISHVPAFQVEGPIDIVGAGDATNAGTVTGLTLGLTLPEAVLLGGCVSSLTIEQIGVTGTTTISDVRQRLTEKLYDESFIIKELQ